MKKPTKSSVIKSIRELEEIYGDSVIFPKKAFHEFIRFLFRKFKLSETDISKIDPIAVGSMPPEWLSEDNSVWLLRNNNSSAVFYKYYHARYFRKSYVYILYSNTMDSFFSNCELLHLYLTIQRGVDLIDAAKRTPAYIDIINSNYLYHEAISHPVDPGTPGES